MMQKPHECYCGICTLGDSEKLTGEGPEQPDVT